MTNQTKHFIELSSILALRLRCNECEAEISLPLSKELRVKRLRVCPHCEHAWTINGSTMEGAIEDAIGASKTVARLLNRDFPVGFSLMLEIKADKPEAEVGVKC